MVALGSGSSVSKPIMVCPFDGKPCSQIILGAPACDGVRTFDVLGEHVVVKSCSRFTKDG